MAKTTEKDLGTRLHICKNCLVPILKDKTNQRWVHINRASTVNEVYYIPICINVLDEYHVMYAEPIRS